MRSLCVSWGGLDILIFLHLLLSRYLLILNVRLEVWKWHILLFFSFWFSLLFLWSFYFLTFCSLMSLILFFCYCYQKKKKTRVLHVSPRDWAKPPVLLDFLTGYIGGFLRKHGYSWNVSLKKSSNIPQAWMLLRLCPPRPLIQRKHLPRWL